MRKTEPSTQVEKIRAAATAGRRSVLYRWMNANFDVFKATIAEAGKPNWAELAKAFAEEQLWDISGNPPTGENARLTWLQVRKTREDKATKAAARQAKSPSLPAVQSPVPETPMVQTIEPDTTARTGSRRTFAISSPKKEI